MADRGASPAGPGAAVGMADGAAGVAVVAGTRLGWAAAASAAATATRAEEGRYVHLITCTRCRSGGLAGALHRARAVGSSAPPDGRARGFGSPCGCASIERARAFDRDSRCR